MNIESIFIPELIEEVCKYLEAGGVINFHLAFNLNMNPRVLMGINNYIDDLEYKIKVIRQKVRDHSCASPANGEILIGAINLIVNDKCPRNINWQRYYNNYWKYDCT